MKNVETFTNGETSGEAPTGKTKRTKRTKLTKTSPMSLTSPVSFMIAFGILLVIAAACVYIYLNINPPAAAPVRVAAWAGVPLSPGDFVSQVTGKDVTIEYTHHQPMLYDTQEIDVEITLYDTRRNTTYVTSRLSAYKLIDTINGVLGDNADSLSAADFIDGEIKEQDAGLFSILTDLSSIDTGKIGSHDIILQLGGIDAPRTVRYEIFDVIPPQGSSVNIECWTVDEIEPSDFVTDITDQTEVTINYAAGEPDRTVEGAQPVEILLTDEGGNTTIVTSRLTQIRDEEPPELTGEFDKAVCIGEAILYRAGITVTDNRDDDIMLMVDSSAVNTRAEGVYPVIYSASDKSGNTTIITGSLTVYDVSFEVVEEMVEDILSSILNEDMTQYEQAYAIYRYVNRRISYGTGRNYDNVYYAAYRAYKAGTGDCYSYYALSELLLTAVGIDNMPIQRIAGYPTRHFWNLVNLGDGWYHFDAIRQPNSGGFLFTDSTAAEITERTRYIRPGYYDYDESLYPEIVQ